MADYLLPQPSPEGIEATRELYRRKPGREISFADAREVLTRVIRYQWGLMQAGMAIAEAKRLEKAAALGYQVKSGPGWPELEEDPEVMPLVRQAFELRAQGVPLRELAEEMEAAGLQTNQGNPVGPTALIAMLKDARYSPHRHHVSDCEASRL